MNQFSFIFICAIILYILYTQFKTDDESTIGLRKNIKKKYEKSTKLYISPTSTEIDNNNLLKNKLITKLSEQFNNEKTNNCTIKNKYTLKLYYADWCPHCVNFKSIWNNCKTSYGNKLIFIDVDCTNNNPDLPYVNGFPTIALFDANNNHIENYDNDGTILSFETYIKNKLI